MSQILVSYMLSNIVSIVSIVSLNIGRRTLPSAAHLGLNPNLEGSKIKCGFANCNFGYALCMDTRISLMISSARISLKLFKEATISYPQNNKSPTSQPLLSFYSYRRSLGTSCPTTPFSFEGTSTILVQAPELITASILAGTPAADGLVAGVTDTLDNGDPSASPNCS